MPDELLTAESRQARASGSECSAGITSLFTESYKTGFEVTFRLLLARGVCADDAQEITQAAWVKAWERLGQLQHPQTLMIWVNSIAINLHRDFLRRRGLQRMWQKTLTAQLSDSRTSLWRIDSDRVLQRCNSRDRTLLEWYYLEGHSIADIAVLIGGSELSVRLRLMRARRRAKERIARPPEP